MSFEHNGKFIRLKKTPKVTTNTFKCECKDVEIGSYDNQIWVHAPAHMPKDMGYSLDACVAEEVMALWMLGITTTGCCCGHGKVYPYIGVSFEDIPRMKELGYTVQPNLSRPNGQNDEDSFVPMGKEYAQNLNRLKTAPATDTGNL